MRPHGRARINARSPEAWGTCDSCGFVYNLRTLRWQYEYAGNRLVNQRFLVCRKCEYEPNPQLRADPIQADPPPLQDVRPNLNAIDD